MPEVVRASAALFDLSRRKVVVTGASSGIGAAIAEGLAAAGSAVFGMSRRDMAPAGVVPIACDLMVSESIEAAFAEVERRCGDLDILVNAAGISLPQATMPELERFRSTIEVNLVAAYACVLAAKPLLQRSGGGAIINITSINTVRGFPGNPGYVAAKSGLAGLTRALAVDLAVDKIRVNALAPGYVHTAMTAVSHGDPVLREERRRHTLLGRWGAPQDMVGAAIFLASDASAYITGQEIFVDGGWSVNGLVASQRDEP
jgi:NAD(P)-dependent dehydrogenase (short-subunit alcohol dehydrogenase family)